MRIPGLGWTPLTIQIPDILREWPAVGLGKHSLFVGDVVPDGLYFWAHFVHIELPEQRAYLPKAFAVKLQPTETKSNTQTVIYVSVDVQEILPHRQQDNNGHWDQSLDEEVTTPTKRTKHFGLVLALFDSGMASRMDFETAAVAVKVTREKDIRAFLSHCAQARNPRF